MTITPDQKQRLCFFTMIENEGQGEFDKTRCLETQTSTVMPLTTFIVKSSIVPENPMGSALFRIETQWQLSSIGSSTSIEISSTVECTKKIWGVTGMVEGMLESQVLKSHRLWLDIARKKLEKIPQPSSEPSSPASVEPQSSIGSPESEPMHSHASPSYFDDEHLRMRLSTYKRVVTGTEKLAQILHQTPSLRTEVAEPPSDSFDIMVHSPDDSTENRLQFKRRGGLSCKTGFAVLLIIVTVASLSFYLYPAQLST
eukprot:TRINITY_DN6535_c0_g1_i3.p1 TRINITY_DN6535_c0_g1~~TRINITY_DN6535_c0_g1_i3.p1  ORF type:complete len:256 (-),score=25.94 TRINITY_DN6535_c0_g1_i3:39-806(-)